MTTGITALHEKAKGLAADYLRTEGELLATLIQMHTARAFAVLNFQGIFDYCVGALGLSEAQAYYFKSVAVKSREVPQISEAVTHGQLTLSQARRIVPVITQENHDQWIEKAKTLSQGELERAVAAANPSARIKERLRPVAKQVSELKVPVDPDTEANLNALKDILSQKQGKAASLEEVIRWAAQVTREKFDPVRRAARAVSLGNRVGNKLGNKRPAQPPKSGRQPIPASVKHPVVLRDEGRCVFVGPDGGRCRQKRWLHVHHGQPVQRGGKNTVDNLRLLCSAHHGLVHTGSVHSTQFRG